QRRRPGPLRPGRPARRPPRRHRRRDQGGAVVRRRREAPAGPDRVQTGVRMERRLVKVLKATAELRDMALGELLERIVLDTFADRPPFDPDGLAKVRELAGIYGLPPEEPS